MEKESFCKFAFTSWKKPNVKVKFFNYLIWSEEYCPSTGLTHYQGYGETKRDYKLFSIKSLFKDREIHIEKARESRMANRMYCFKESFYVNRFEYEDPISKSYNNFNDWTLRFEDNYEYNYLEPNGTP